MNSHCIQIIQIVKKNTLQINTNNSLPNAYEKYAYIKYNVF